jgi:hypothetical protein
MSLGLVASAASALRLVYTSKFVSLDDPLYDIAIPAIWGNVEEFLGIIAACLPFLRVPFERILGKIGMLTQSDSTRSQSSYHLSSLNNGARIGASRIRGKEIITPESPLYGSGRSTEILYSHKA